ncbi:MAG: DNA repair protein RadC [Elusimicrobia bacterium]|nr:DNA repair protein RadC [Elusimicrobiota bacterium]
MGVESRERLQRFGPQALRDDELLALVTASGLSSDGGLEVARELVRRFDRPAESAPDVGGPRQVYEQLHWLRRRRKEHFVALYVNARNRLLHVETVSIGTLTASLVHPREVFGPAVERAAAGLIVAHNHPSGDPRPSAEDRAATRRLERAGRILGVPLLDHVVVAESGYYSFREEGLLTS